MTHAMRLPLPLIALFALVLLIPSSGKEGRDMFGTARWMTAEQVALDPSDPGRTRVGALTYLGGVVLHGPGPAFGGFSSMTVVGDRFTLLNDGGLWVRFRMGGDWKPREMEFGDLPDGPYNGWRKQSRDSESMTRDPAGRVWVGFEFNNQIWRYDPTLTRAEEQARPPAIKNWDENGGAESMVRLHDGRFVVLSETTMTKDGRGRIGLLFPDDPTEDDTPPVSFGYAPPAGYDPSDATQLPDGRLIVVNRRFSLPGLFTAKLTLIDPRKIAPGALLRGPVIAAFASPLLHDNFEALAVTQEGKDVILWMASDDNQQIWEQSLLLKFRVEFGKR
jgi:hypothetical protein